MQKLILLPLLAVAAPAAAQPVTQPSACQVTISRAPDDVRDAIEAWVAAEPRCATTLDVRVVPTDGGLYLFARDAAGRVRERIVPDAQSAAVLVASWVADDLIARHAPEPLPPPSPSPSVERTFAPPVTNPVLAPPGTFAPTPLANVDRAPARSGREPHGRWLTVGGSTDSMLETAGLRAELDVMRRGRWTLGAALARTGVPIQLMSGSAYGYLDTTDTRVIATLNHTTPFGRRWELRLAVGAGFVYTEAGGWFDTAPVEGAGWFPTAEASAMLACRFGERWAVMVGPIATGNAQTYQLEGSSGTYTYDRDDVEMSAFAGLRRRL